MVLVVADCTGHGVPGAFMSMIGNELLNQIVNVHRESDPSEILKSLHFGILYALQQEQSNSSDGMDIAIVTLTRNEGKITQLEFSGAMNPLYVIQNNEFKEFKGTKIPIGGKLKDKVRAFEKHTLTITEENSTYLYLCTDGYQDQFGGEKKLKFMPKNLRNLLLEHHQKTMAEQHQILETTLLNWISLGNEEQTDDITIFGVKI
jgi:serine phosphatase RsbU (regulator of sigma subunit)